MAREISWKKRTKTGVSAFHHSGSLKYYFVHVVDFLMKLQVNHLFYKYIKNAKRCFLKL